MTGRNWRRDRTMSDVSHPRDYERTDVDARLLGALAIGIAVFVVISPLLLSVIYPGASRNKAAITQAPEPPASRLQVNAKVDLDRLHAAERERLSTYGWTDRQHQLVRIPIERAMQLLSERGRADWPKPDSSKPDSSKPAGASR